MPRRILIYTDSRGQHKPKGQPPYEIFARRLAAHSGVEAEVVQCPKQWTTLIDFLTFLESHPPENYDNIILYAGIVDWSPRTQEGAIQNVYNNQTAHDPKRVKIIDNKKAAFDAIFSEKAMGDHLRNGSEIIYEGQPTVNMYSLDMARDSLIPRLKKLNNLIFINSNRLIPGWEGDYPGNRPANINITEEYSELFYKELGNDRVVNLLDWTHDEVKQYTCDNMHLTKNGSDWIYRQLCERLQLNEGSNEIQSAKSDKAANASPKLFAPFGFPLLPPQQIDANKRTQILRDAGLKTNEKLATLIIGFRLNDIQDRRTANLRFLLSWIDRFYGDLFDVLLVEQDTDSKIDWISSQLKPYMRHKLIYNPNKFNRGWGYNAAVRNYTKASVVVLMDTDFLTGENFVQEIVDCHKNKYSIVSPFKGMYFTDEEEALHLEESYNLSSLTNTDKVSKPTTIGGGTVIIRRDVFEENAGFEQYTSYGCEDRAFDVTMLNKLDASSVRMAPYTYVHMYHPVGAIDRGQLTALLDHLNENYGCRVDRTLSPADSIHKNCSHVSLEKTTENSEKRRLTYGDVHLYQSGRPLTVNGFYADETPTQKAKVMLPPDFTSLSEYEHKEFYKHVAKVCDPDTEKLEGLYNKFLGARCFIIGNGPSLNRHDLSLLEGEYVFAVNSFFYKTDETGFRPTFFVVEDDAVIKENVEQIKAFQAPYKFFPTIYKDLHGEGDNVYFFSANRGYYEKSSPNYCIPRFSTDASKVLYCGQSVTYINMQLAFFLGFTEVYLIGMDFDYVIPKDHGRRGDLIFSTTDDPNHFHKDYFGKGKTWKDPKLDRVGMSYRQAKLSYEAVGRRIYNATIGGKLEIFPRVDYEALLRDPQTKSKRNAAVAPASITAGEGEGQTIAPPAAIVPVVMENTMPTTGAMPVEGGERSLPVQAERTRAEIRAARRAKLRRDPHLFFKDSHFFALRPLRYLFKPTGIGKWQAEMETKSDHDTDGFFSFLPVSRKALAISRTASNSERNRSEAALRSEIAQLRKLAAAREKQEHDSKRVLQDEFNKQFSALDLRLKALPEELEAKDLARAQNIEIALREELAVLGQQITAGLEKSTESESVLRAEILAMQQGIDQRLHAEIDERSQRHLNELRQEVVELTTKLDTQGAAVTSYNTTFAAELEEIKTANQNAGEKIRESIEALKGSGARQTKAANFLLQRVMTSEQQISAMRYPDAPQTLVFFGHHKCASRLFRGEVFKVVAEATGAHIHQYEIKSPPFHYSRGDELDLCNMDFDLIGRDGRDVVLFSNASERTLKRLNRATKDWRGIRIIRDPRQVFISNYFHHKGDHRTEHNGWVYDQLKHDQPLLRELPEEEGLLHELDHISKDVIETQILAPFQDERVLTIKLEDFGMNEKAWLKQISEFLGVADIAGVDLSRTFANPDSSPWQQHFTSRLRSVFKERYGQALIDLGYADDLNW